jgi:hypothetical protein
MHLYYPITPYPQLYAKAHDQVADGAATVLAVHVAGPLAFQYAPAGSALVADAATALIDTLLPDLRKGQSPRSR